MVFGVRVSPIILGITLTGLLLLPIIQGGNFIDLTYAFNNETVTFPGRNYSRNPTFTVEAEDYTTGGYWYSSKGFCLSEHTGTHIDAPYHFYKTGKTLDQIPLEDLLDVPGVMIDIYDKVHKYENGNINLIKNYGLTREDILEWEKANGVIPQRAIVLVRSGWGSHWPNKIQYLGLESPQNASYSIEDIDNLNFPGFDASGAKFLTTERQILGVGIDTLSVDVGSSKLFPVHRILAARGVYSLENVANLHLLPHKGFRIWAIPFKVDRATGAPTRLLARLNLNN